MIKFFYICLFLYACTGFPQSTRNPLEKQTKSKAVIEHADNLRREWWFHNAGDSYDVQLAVKLMSQLDDWSASLITHAPDHAAGVVITNGITQLRNVMLERVELLQRTILKQHDNQTRLEALRLAQHVLSTFPWELPTKRCEYIGTTVMMANALGVDKQRVIISLSDRVNADGLDDIAVSAILGMLDALGFPRTDDTSGIDIDVRAYETCKMIIERALKEHTNAPKAQGEVGEGH